MLAKFFSSLVDLCKNQEHFLKLDVLIISAQIQYFAYAKFYYFSSLLGSKVLTGPVCSQIQHLQNTLASDWLLYRAVKSFFSTCAIGIGNRIFTSSINLHECFQFELIKHKSKLIPY